MNEVEKRRLQLLEETRNQYRSTYNPPAVHPRYEAAFRYASHEAEITQSNHTWVVRFVIAILIFSMFYLMDVRNEQIGTIDSQQIVEAVQRDLLGK